MLLVTEGDAEIDCQPATLVSVTEAVDRQIHSDLTHAAQRRKGQLVRRRHQAAPVEAAEPKYTSPAEIGTRLLPDVLTSMQPVSSMPSNVPSRVERSEEHTSELQSPCNLVCRL